MNISNLLFKEYEYYVYGNHANERTSIIAKTLMNGQTRIAASEIKSDQSRGLDAKEKEEALADMEEKLQKISDDMSDSITELNERIEADQEKIRAEEAAKTKETAKTGTDTDATSSGQTKTNGTSTEHTDMVDISAFAQNVATSSPPVAPEIPVEQTVQIGAAVDVKA